MQEPFVLRYPNNPNVLRMRSNAIVDIKNMAGMKLIELIDLALFYLKRERAVDKMAIVVSGMQFAVF